MGVPGVQQHLRELRTGAPVPLLPRSAEARLGPRHREVLDEIEAVFVERGFASFTIADLASSVGCSRRTLYELAPSKDQLVLVVLDRFLHKKGRAALDAIDPTTSVVDQVRDYLAGGIEFGWEHRFSDDLADDAPARRLVDHHYRFVMTVVERLLVRGVERGELRHVDTAVAAATLTGASLFISEPDLIERFGRPAHRVVDQIVQLVVPPLALP
ncbi:MAG: TetR/AcrR family transcriptional regulator [Actinomycetota bacterium]